RSLPRRRLAEHAHGAGAARAPSDALGSSSHVEGAKLPGERRLRVRRPYALPGRPSSGVLLEQPRIRYLVARSGRYVPRHRGPAAGLFAMRSTRKKAHFNPSMAGVWMASIALAVAGCLDMPILHVAKPPVDGD